MGVANFVRQVYTMHFSIKCEDCSFVPSREKRTKCASMRVRQKSSKHFLVSSVFFEKMLEFSQKILSLSFWALEFISKKTPEVVLLRTKNASTYYVQLYNINK